MTLHIQEGKLRCQWTASAEIFFAGRAYSVIGVFKAVKDRNDSKWRYRTRRESANVSGKVGVEKNGRIRPCRCVDTSPYLGWLEELQESTAVDRTFVA